MEYVKLVTPKGVKWIVPKLRLYQTLVRVLLRRGGHVYV